MSRISRGKCSQCGDRNATVAQIDSKRICRTCNPDNWESVSDMQKQAWLRGELDQLLVWNKSGHSQR